MHYEIGSKSKKEHVALLKDPGMRPCNRNIMKVLSCAGKLLLIADEGDLYRDDDGCGVLYGIVRDSAYKIKKQAEMEREKHKKLGKWDGDKNKQKVNDVILPIA
jgi:hypothetical protein